MGMVNGVIVYDAERTWEMPAVKNDPEERRLVNEVNRMRKRLYGEEDRFKAARASMDGLVLTAADHELLDKASALVTEVRVNLGLAERALQDHREKQARASRGR